MARPMEGVVKVSPSQYQPQSVPFTTNKKLKQINFIFVLQQHLISHISHQNQWIFKLLPPFVLMRLCPIRREPRIAKAKCALAVSHPRSSHCATSGLPAFWVHHLGLSKQTIGIILGACCEGQELRPQTSPGDYLLFYWLDLARLAHFACDG